MARSLTSSPRTTSRLVLRPFRRRDVDQLVEAVRASLDGMMQWLPWAHAGYGRLDALQFIRESAAAWSEGRAYDFTIRRPDEPDRHLGNISIWFTSKASGTGEMGYWVRSDEAGRGIATEAAARILELAFDELAMHRVALRIAVGNAASETIAQRLGFVKEGLLRDELRVHGRWVDHTIWGLLEPEYRTLRTGYDTAGWA